ncbi:hypothetical protein DH2020_012180 [Rehmannia glutinosa]|uniref:Uncharacterized protein n=1 Tax=Rehmannia glutinosa TaxID=99300 RepID=A0ABR0W331_REHGL
MKENMKFLQILRKAVTSPENRHRVASISANARPYSHQLHSQHSHPASFGIAFDIDGVILRGDTPIGGSPQALRRLYDDSGDFAFRIPVAIASLYKAYIRPFFISMRYCVDMGFHCGGVPESKRATELSKLLSVSILYPPRFENELIIAVGKGEPALVMSEYGFKNVLTIDEYASYFEHIDPLGKFKNWVNQQAGYDKSFSGELDRRNDPCSQRVQAVFIVSDSVDWSRDIQFSYMKGLFPTERLGMGAFRIALESIYNRIYPNVLEYTSYGKPNPSVFRNAENVLMQVVPSTISPQINGQIPFKTLYMIGDNPSVDIKGAQQAGQPWFSILTRSGVFKGKENHPLYPADLVVDTVEEAVDYILRKEAF